MEYDQNGRIKTRYVHGLGIDEHLAIEKKDAVYYYHADGLGSITALTDKKQHVVQTYHYDSFGNEKQQDERVRQPYTFTGRERDEEIGLYYYRARYYDPKAGRFISFDPILHPTNEPRAAINPNTITFSDLLVSPQSLNPFSYTQGNPTTLVDPSGEAACIYSIMLKMLVCVAVQQPRVISCSAISGNNNLLDQNVQNVGPIPLGIWSIGNPGSGMRAPLSPIAAITYGRSGFQIHGWGTSRGCIAIYLNACRDAVMDALRCDNGGILTVTP